MLEALDPTTPLGRIYTTLVAHPHATAPQIAAAVSLDEREVRAGVEALRAAGLATVRDDVSPRIWEAEPPDRAIEEVLDAAELRLVSARRTSQQLSRLYWMARHETARHPGLEVIRDPAQIRQQNRLIVDMAVRVVRSANRPPCEAWSDTGAVEAEVAARTASMRAGVAHRTIWWDGLFEDPVTSAAALALMNKGEQARILPGLPTKMIIADDRRAMIPLDPDGEADGATLVIHPSGLLTALISIYDTLWGVAAPISGPRRTPGLSDQERAILTLMVAGVTDDAIARRLRISRRTVVRHSARLFERLGAKTRFQAGAQAVRRGWL